MNARLASLALLVFALPAAAQHPARFLVEGRVLLPAGSRAGDPIEIVARRGAARAPVLGAALATTRPDAEGRFRLALDLAESGFYVALESRWLELRPLWIEPAPGERSIEVLLAPAARGVLHGRFVAPTDEPFSTDFLAGSWVWIEGGERCVAEVDASGEFELVGPASCLAGPLIACPRDFAPLFLDAPILEDGRLHELDLPLLEAAHVRGRVVDAAEHALAGVTLSLARGPEFAEPLPLDPWGDVRTVTSGTDGSFEIGALPPGDLRLSALDPRWRAQDALITGLRPGEDRAGVRVHLARAAALHGTVADEYALGVPGVRVTAGARSGMGNVQVTTTDQAGHYRFDSLAPGDYVLAASVDAQATASRSVLTLGEGERELADLVLGAASELELSLREHPAPVQVRVEDAAGFLRAEQRVWHGELELTLAPGIYRVSIVARDGQRLERRVLLTGRESQPVLLRM